MPGPPPKPPAIRQRRNKATTRSTLGPAPRAKRPHLHDRPCTCLPSDQEKCTFCGGTGVHPWHEQTVAEWERIWSSSMAREYLQADLGGLLIYIDLFDQYSWTRDVDLAKELRLQRVPYGITPIDRRRLEWAVDQGDEDERPAAQEPPRRRRGQAAIDPRRILQAVK